MRKVYRLHDTVILGIVRSLQEALFTGTDVSDHFRMMRLEPMRDDQNTLMFTPEYNDQVETNLQKLAAQGEKMAEEKKASEAQEAKLPAPVIFDPTQVKFGV